MSIIKVTLPLGEIPVNGKQVSFVAPCDCAGTEALQIDGVNYTVVDALCRCVTGVGGRWEAGAVVSVILDTDRKYAFIQNPTPTAADTGAYALNADKILLPGADLNDLSKAEHIGVYRCQTQGDAQQLLNTPFTELSITAYSFSLVVERTGGQTGIYLHQTIRCNNGEATMYRRAYSGGAWGAWCKAYSGNDKPTAAEIGAVASDGSVPMTAGLKFRSNGTEVGAVSANANNAYLSAYRADNRANRRILSIKPPEIASDFKAALVFSNYVNDAESQYKVLHMGNILDNNITRAVVGSYTGDGTSGSSKLKKVTVGFPPKFAIIYKADMGALFGNGIATPYGSNTIIAGRNATSAKRFSPYGSSGDSNLAELQDNFTWGSTSMSWYTTLASGGDAGAVGQMNESGVTYNYVIFG